MKTAVSNPRPRNGKSCWTFRAGAWLALAGLLLAAPGAQAADDNVPPPPVDQQQAAPKNQSAPSDVPPPLPDEPSDDSRIPPKPQVRIIHRKEATIEEYRVGGHLRYAKIIPTSGPPYYMVDTNGDGQLDKRYNNLDNPPVQQWLLMEW
jgi:hypothetical protein